MRRTRAALAVATAIVFGMSALFLAYHVIQMRFECTDKSIAVLPFENRSEDKANAYFADSIQDEILTRLSKIADLKVISRTSTQQYQERTGRISRDRKATWRSPHFGRKRTKEWRLRSGERSADQGR